jgi:hypothetical protein
MENVEFINHEGTLCAIIVRHNARSEKKYNFLTQESNPLQLGMSFYGKGERIKNHIHLPRKIEVNQVQEYIVISEGRVRLDIIDADQMPIHSTEMVSGDSVLLLAGGHGFEILEPTKIVEIKQGPYDGHSVDKKVFD